MHRTGPRSTEAADTLAELGCRLVSQATAAQNTERQRYLQDIQLENRQKFWQWLVGAALAVVVAETWLAGRTTKRSLATVVNA